DCSPHTWANGHALQPPAGRPDEGPYPFAVWLVALDDQVYVRLGGRAAARVEKSKSAPYVGVTVAGRHFEHVRCQPVPDAAPRVAEAMSQKYWSDLIIHHFPHPLTCRLVPE